MADRRLNAVATANEYDAGNIKGLDDAMTRRLVASTVMTESNGGDLRITNAQGYVGRYQAGAGWLVEAGYVDRDKYRAAMAGYKTEWAWADSGNRDKMDKFLADPSNWKNGLTLEKYKSSAELQDTAFKTVCDANYTRATKSGLLKEGDSPDRIAGFMKAAHISGYGGAENVLNGGRVRKDGNGTSNYDYYHDITRNRDGLDTLMSRETKREPQDRSTTTAPASKSDSNESMDAGADGVYRLGEKGEDIRGLQISLNQLGYRDAQGNKLAEDSDFGAHTKEAVSAFQRDNRLKPDGIAGPKTLEAIGQRLPEGKITADGKVTGLLPMRDAAHPGNAMYTQAYDQLKALGQEKGGYRSEQELRNAAGSIAADASLSGLSRIDHVTRSTNGAGYFAVQGEMNDPAHRRAYVDGAQARSQPLEQSSQTMLQETQKPVAPTPTQDREQPGRTLIA